MPSASSDIALQLYGVTRLFDGVTVLSDISLEIPEGKITTLLGESGCGKSTLLRLISGVDHPDNGRICLGQREIVGPDCFVEPEDRKIGFMLQDFALFPHLSVEANLAFGLRHLSKSEQAQQVKIISERIGIEHLFGRFPHTLSGGEQQRVALARALAPNPVILLMDEPFSNLDRGLREQVREETLNTLREMSATAIIVTHDPEEALAISDLIVLMHKNKIAQIDAPYDIYDHPKSAYVANFMGQCNAVEGVWRRGYVESPLGQIPAILDLPEGALVRVCIRPHALSVVPVGSGIVSRVLTRAFLGESERIRVEVAGVSEPLSIHCRDRVHRAVDDEIWLKIDPTRIHIFPLVPY